MVGVLVPEDVSEEMAEPPRMGARFERMPVLVRLSVGIAGVSLRDLSCEYMRRSGRRVKVRGSTDIAFVVRVSYLDVDRFHGSIEYAGGHDQQVSMDGRAMRYITHWFQN